MQSAHSRALWIKSSRKRGAIEDEENLSLVRKMALRVVKRHNDKGSVKERLSRAALSQDYLKEIPLVNFDAVVLDF